MAIWNCHPTWQQIEVYLPMSEFRRNKINQVFSLIYATMFRAFRCSLPGGHIWRMSQLHLWPDGIFTDTQNFPQGYLLWDIEFAVSSNYMTDFSRWPLKVAILGYEGPINASVVAFINLTDLILWNLQSRNTHSRLFFIAFDPYHRLTFSMTWNLISLSRQSNSYFGLRVTKSWKYI